MNFQNMKKALNRSRKAVLTLGVVSAGLVGAVVMLSAKLYSQSNQVVLVPTTVSDGMVARGTVDKGYVEALALDAVYAMYNSSPRTLHYGRSVLERLSGPAERASILDTYDRIAKDITERKISTVFFPRKIEHNFATYEVVVEGDLATYLETTQVTREDRRILIRFKPQAGSVRLAAIGKISAEE
ncbi:TraE/TraK family type IV conjugative transfer system protein [Leisingera sp. SS27]|uniref:TraE/TraK family type IV conjugative transfer system protein n=1 Tax=Leisingera sp. SS27 TaxID=2979462 RepID=UPI00232C288B|nr:TraE/TraK family type IV conjugative transfer system protein [Leisingera sp. SS27]MDC0660618.1 TraE/TraK family type IV conjugative transfer system protein [Leisingera sp. SS27]